MSMPVSSGFNSLEKKHPSGSQNISFVPAEVI